jgi:hypothetical protein
MDSQTQSTTNETTLYPAAFKKMPFAVNDEIIETFLIRTMTINFNNPNFQKAAGCDDFDFNFARRVALLSEFMKVMTEKYHVVIFNIQEVSSRFMHAEEFRMSILRELFKISKTWTATSPIGGYGDSLNCLNLMTFWNADVLHLNNLINLHYSDGDVRDVGDKLCQDLNIFATSNALVMDMSLIKPSKPLIDGIYHSEGVSIDNRAKFLNINTHIPLRGPLKIKCMQKLHDFINSYPKISTYFVIVSGDMNLFTDEIQCQEIINIMTKIGSLSANLHGYILETMFSTPEKPSLRTNTFYGMLYDLIKNMKLPLNKKKYNIWLSGDIKMIEDVFNRDVQPLDWIISKDTKWCQSLITKVITIEDMIELGFKFNEPKNQNQDQNQEQDLKNILIDVGNYLTYHLPLITTIEVIGIKIE